MAISNKERVGRVLDALAKGLGSYALREYYAIYQNTFLQEIDATLTTRSFELPREALQNTDTLIKYIDAHSALNLMWRRWNDVFQDKLGHSGRSYT